MAELSKEIGMAITKRHEVDFEKRGVSINVRISTIIEDGDVELSRKYHRLVIQPGDPADVTVTMPDGAEVYIGDDVVPLCEKYHTEEVVAAFKAAQEAAI